MSNIAFIFAGQGTQKVGMGKDIYELYPAVKTIFDAIDPDIKETMFEGPVDKLNDTKYAQVAIVALSIALNNLLKDKGIHPLMSAGLSLGEYSALCSANVFSLEDTLDLVKERGLMMHQALKGDNSKMVAVISNNYEEIVKACEYGSTWGICQIANHNSPNQYVISGENEAIDKACSYLKEKGINRLMPLSVTGGFHSDLLKETALKFKDVISTYNYQLPTIPVVFNCEACVSDKPLDELLSKQMCSTVYFKESIEYMIEQGIDTFIEIGPKPSLKRLIQSTNKEVNVYSVCNNESLNTVIKEFVV